MLIKRIAVIFIYLLSLESNAFATSAEKPNYIVKPTLMIVGFGSQKAITFSSKMNDGPYSLIIKNGSGEALNKKVCSGNFVKQILCLASNLLVEVRIQVERVSAADIELNGKKIITLKQFNSSVASVQVPVDLTSSNKLQIKLTGKATSSITYEIRGKAAPAIKGTLTLSSPANNSNLSSYSTVVKGRVDSSAPNLKVMIGSETEIPGIVANTEFSYEFEYLEAGPNTMRLSLYSGSTLLDTKLVNLNVTLPGEMGSTIAVSGGKISVTNSSSSLFGSSVEVPPGALAASKYIIIQHGDSWGPNIPAIYTEVGPAVSLNPLLQNFSKPVKIVIPYLSNLMPAGALEGNIKILGYDGEGWKKLEPTSISAGSATIQSNIFGFYAYKAVVETPVAEGQLQVLSDVSGATVYIDGLFFGDLTSATLDSVSAGIHTIKVYREGYNEVQQVITYPTQKRVQINLTALVSNAPVVQLNSSLIDGMIVSDNLIDIKGQITLDPNVTSEGFVVLSQNNRDVSLPLSADGNFSFIAPLFQGENEIHVRATVNGRTGISKKINIVQGEAATALRSARTIVNNYEGALASKLEQDKYSVAVRNEKLNSAPMPKASARSAVALAAADEAERLDQQIKVVLSWNKADTDVDLHIYDEYGGHAFYSALGGISQGTLDRDDVDGFGPEIFTLNTPRVGKYPIRVHYFSDNEKGSATATVNVFLAGQLIYQGSRTLSTGQWWDVYTVDIQNIVIKKVQSRLGKSSEPMPKECNSYSKFTCVNSIFTTMSSESIISVDVSAPASVADNQIRYRIKEKSRNFDLSFSGSGRAISFEARNRSLASLTSPATSKRLVYEVVAYTTTGLESAPYYIVQDTRSQIRQEYIDKKSFAPSFARAIPSYNEISTGSNFSEPNFYTYSEMIEYSDFFVYGLGIINKSIQIANSVNSAYIAANPGSGRLVLTSGWRNPRRNDGLKADASLNSYHQSGDSIDILPPITSRDPEIRIQNLKRLCEIAYANTVNTDVIYHAGHVHIEPYNGIGRAKNCTGTAN